MLRSFKLKMALFSACTSGIILVGFALLFMTMIRRIGLERIDRHLHAVTEAQLHRPVPEEHWSRFDGSLAAMYGDERPRQFLVRVLDRNGKPVYTSARWPRSLTAEALGVSPAYLKLRLGRDPRPSPLRFRPLQPDDAQPPPRALRPEDAPRPPRALWPEEEPRPPRALRPDEEPRPPRPLLKRPLFVTVPIDGHPWRMIVLGTDDQTLIVGTDLADFQAELQRHWSTFGVAGPIALLLLATGGWLLAGQALRPVRILTQVADGMTAKDLSQRVNSPGADREFKALIDVINGMLDRLEKSFQQAARFSANAAHELKTPLTILQGQLEQAVQCAPAASQEQRTYADLLEEVQRLKGIVRKLLLLAQSDSGQLRLSLESVCLTEELEALFEDLPLLAPGLALRKELAPGIRVMADPDLFRQVLQNLFSNAYKYNREGGFIECLLRREGACAVLSLTNSAAPDLHIDRERLFDRFYRGDLSRNRKVDGTGLGLSLAREISRAHGGDLTAEPAQEGWVTFRLTLPTDCQ
jgi:heavy metal sensor kinase